MGAEAFAEVVRVVAEKGDYRCEVASKTKSDEIKYIELSAFAMRDGSGEPICYVGIKRDITKRKQAEQALQRSEAELTDFFENAAVALHWVGPDGIIMRVNQAELDMLGYTRDEYVGRHIAEFHVDQNVIEDILTRLDAGEVLQNYEARLRCKDGALKHVRISSSVYREDGKFIHTRCFTRDITERKRTEGRLSLQYAVTQILAESQDLLESGKKIIEAACNRLSWEVGAFWKVDAPRRSLALRRSLSRWFYGNASIRWTDAEHGFAKGVGLPGRIWASGQPCWIDNVVADKNFPRARVAALEGLHGAFGFPILVGNEALGSNRILQFRNPRAG